MEQLPALSPVLCIVLLIPTWTAAVAEIPDGCKRVQIPNVGASAQKPAGLGVSQEPRSLNATVGENMTLSCSFQNRNGSRTNVLWLRGSGEDVVLDSNHPFYRGRLRVSRMDEHRQGKATLTLTELQERDSALYQCCIEIDRGETRMGGGTELRVMRRNQSATDPLSCTFQNRQGSRAKVLWLRGSTEDLELDSSHPFYRGRLRVSRMDEHRQGKATLTLTELQERDSALYQCCIELDRGETGMGEGTELRVMRRHRSATRAPGGRELCQDSGPLFYRAVISLSLVILFSLGIILSLRPWNGVPVDPTVGAGPKLPQAPGQVSLI